MAQFDKISINGVPYNVHDTGTANALSELETTVTQQGEQITQQGVTIQQQGETIQQQGETIKQQGETIEQHWSQVQKQIAQINSAYKLKTVKDYGATGDGTGDDTQAFVHSLEDQNVAIIPPGTYNVSSFTVTGGQSVYGYGPDVSIIKAIGTGQNVIVGNNSREAILSRFSINGNKTANNGIHFDGCPGCSFVDVTVHDCKNDGFHVTGQSYTTSAVWKITNCFAYANGACGFYITTIDVTLHGCTSVSNAQINREAAGIDIDGVAAKISDCHCWSRSDDAGYFRPKTALRLDGPDIEVVNSHIEGAAQQCLLLGSNCARLRMTNCDIYAPFGSALVYTAAWGSAFVACNFDASPSNCLSTFTGNPEQLSIMGCSFLGNKPIVTSGAINNSYIQAFTDAKFETFKQNLNVLGCRGYIQSSGGIWNNLGQ